MAAIARRLFGLGRPEPQGENHFNKLPDELVLKIFKNVETTKPLALVDRRFNKISKEPSIVREEFINDIIQLVRLVSLEDEGEALLQREYQHAENLYNNNEAVLTDKFPNNSKKQIIEVIYKCFMLEVISNNFIIPLNTEPLENANANENILNQLLEVNSLNEAISKLFPAYKQIIAALMEVQSRHITKECYRGEQVLNKVDKEPISDIEKIKKLDKWARSIGAKNKELIEKASLIGKVAAKAYIIAKERLVG